MTPVSCEQVNSLAGHHVCITAPPLSTASNSRQSTVYESFSCLLCLPVSRLGNAWTKKSPIPVVVVNDGKKSQKTTVVSTSQQANKHVAQTWFPYRNEDIVSDCAHSLNWSAAVHRSEKLR